MDTKANQRQLILLVAQHLSESIPVTRILSYQPAKNGSVTGKFESNGRVFSFSFNGDDVRYKPAGNMDSDLFSHLYLERFDATQKAIKGTRALPRCTSQSYSCKGAKGTACISLTKSCKMQSSAVGRERLGKIQEIVRAIGNPSRYYSGYNTPETQAKLKSSESSVLTKRKELSDQKKGGWKNASEQKESKKLTKGEAAIDKKRKELEKKQSALEKEQMRIRETEGKNEAYYDLESQIDNMAGLLKNYSVLPEIEKRQRARHKAKRDKFNKEMEARFAKKP